jgi:proline dehydrogenase
MGLMRNVLLAAAQNRWLKEQAPKYGFVRRTVERFMPGERIEDAMAAAKGLEAAGMATVFTHLGENVTDEREAAGVAEHYVEVLRRVREAGLGTEVSVKLTHLGLDLSAELCMENLERVVRAAREEGGRGTVWIDMEASGYVDRTLEIFRRTRRKHENVGVCLQAYLCRTKNDLDELLGMEPAIRLVKGAYQESAEVAYPRKQDVDANYFALAKRMLEAKGRGEKVRAAMATHDTVLIRQIQAESKRAGAGQKEFEFQMLYGIQREEQMRLARDGWNSAVLVAYGSHWYPWFMRRLAERPANVMFAVRNMIGN